MRPKSWIYVSVTLLILATILQIGGLLTPCWIWLQTSDSRVGVGLYFRVGCEAPSGENCTDPTFPKDLPFGYNTDATYDKPEWEAMVWLQTLSSVTSLIVCMMMFVYAVGFGVWRHMGALNMYMTLLCVITWVFSLAGLIVYVVFYGEVMTRSPDISSRSFPWSVMMVFFATVIFIIVTVLIRLRCRKRNFLHHSIPTSADSKMALNPSTKSQVMKRYFTPTPYREARREGVMVTASSEASQVTFDQIKTPAPFQINTLERGPSVNDLNVLTSNGQDVFQAPVSERSLWFAEENKRRNVSPFFGTANYRPETSDGYRASPSIAPLGFGNVTAHGAAEETSIANRRRQQLVEQQQQHHHGSLGKECTLLRRQHGSPEPLTDIAIDHHDAETLFYTGTESLPYQSFSFTPEIMVFRSEGFPSQDQSYINNGFTLDKIEGSSEIRRNPSNVQLAQVNASPELVKEAFKEENGNFRLGAEHMVGDSVRDLQATTHMRSRITGDTEQLFTGRQLGSGEGFAYNGTYIYRPYSEQIY